MSLSFIYLLVTLTTILIVSHFRKKEEPYYVSLLTKMFMVTSFYATYKTNGHTMFIVPALFATILICHKIKTIRFYSFSLRAHIVIGVLIAIFIWLLAGGFSDNLKIPFIDYLFYERVSYFNDLFGLENIGATVNIFDKTLPRNQFYHHFEGWLVSLLHHVNGESRMWNYYVVVLPIFFVALVSFIAENMVFFGFTGDKYSHKVLFLSFLFGILAMFVQVPYEVVISYFKNYVQLPSTGFNSMFMSPKVMLALPSIMLSYELAVNSFDFKKALLLIIFAFFYPPVLIVSIGSIAMVFISSNYRDPKYWIWLLCVLIVVLSLLALYSGSASNNNFELLNLKNTINFKHILLNYFKAFILWFFLPFGVFVLPYILSRKTLAFDTGKTSVLKWLLFMFTLGLLWTGAFYEVIDAQQIWLNFAIPLTALLIIVTLGKLYNSKKYTTLIIVFIGVIPILNISNNPYGFTKSKLSKGIINHIADKNIVTIATIPNSTFMISHYRYNDFFYNCYSEITVFLPDLIIIGLNSSMPINPSFKESDLKWVNFYRDRSLFYKYCGEFTNKNNYCLVSWLKNNKIEYVLSMQSLDENLFTLIDSSDLDYLYSVK